MYYHQLIYVITLYCVLTEKDSLLDSSQSSLRGLAVVVGQKMFKQITIIAAKTSSAVITYAAQPTDTHVGTHAAARARAFTHTDTRRTHTHTHTDTQTHTQTQTQTQTHTHTLTAFSLSLSLSHTHTHSRYKHTRERDYPSLSAAVSVP